MKYVSLKTTGSAALNYQVGSTQQDYEFLGFRLHLTSALAQATAVVNLTVTGRASDSTASDFRFNHLTLAMSGSSDVAWYPDPPIPRKQNDLMEIAWVNDAASYKAWAFEALWREV